MELTSDKALSARILIVDDDEITLRIMQRVLNSQGFDQITLCDCATAGLAVLNADADPIDILFLDMNLPEMNALEFVELFDAERFKGRVVLLSAEDEKVLINAETMISQRNIRVSGHIQKPIARDQVIAVMGKLFQNL